MRETIDDGNGVIIEIESSKQEAIWITAKAKKRIDEFKIHPREPYYSVMDRLLFNNTTGKNKPLK